MFTYTPNTAFVGADKFLYKVCDNGIPQLCDTAILFIDVLPVNDEPIANVDHFAVVINNTLSGTVVNNDVDIDSGTLTTTIVSTTSSGTLTLNADGTFTYTPNQGFLGVDSFVYTLCDDGVPPLCDTAIAFIKVTLMNHPPIAIDDVATGVDGLSLTGDVLINDKDPMEIR